MSQPTVIAVDDDAEALQAIERELRKRYSTDYDIKCECSATVALRQLEELKMLGSEVTLLLADQWMPEMTGIEFLARAHELHPHAKRALLINWGDHSTAEPILQAVAMGQIDAYMAKPWGSPDEEFHKFITDFLDDWARLHRPRFQAVQIIGELWAPRSHELRDLFERNGIPYGFYDVHSEQGQALLRQVQCLDGPFPVVILLSNRVITDPSNVELADALSVNTQPEEAVYDLTIIGAGPAGLSAAVYGASEGLRTMVVESQAIGGQAGTSSLIRNYLGFPRGISGRQLATRAYQQAWFFGAHFYFMREAAGLRAVGHERVVVLTDGIEIISHTVVLAMGVTYLRLGIPRLEALIGAGVFYGAAVTEAQAMKGQEVFVAGAGNSAGQAALYLAKYATRVTVLVRSGSFAASMSDYLVKEIAASNNIDVRLHTQIIDGLGEHRLHGLVLYNTASGTTETVPATALFVLIGTQPHTSWLPATIQCNERGFILTGYDLLHQGSLPKGWALNRPPLPFETSMPGVFVVGDVRHRSVKRVASAVGEGSIAIQQVHEYLGEQ